MSTIPGNISPSLTHALLSQDGLQGTRNQAQPQAPQARDGSARVGGGTLAHRQIAIGNGQARGDAVDHAARAKSFFKTCGKVLAGIALAPLAVAAGVVAGGVMLATRALCQIPRLINEKALEPASDKRFELAHKDVIDGLRRPLDGGLAANELVMARVIEHAHKQGTPIGDTELRGLVAAGERLARALSAGQPAQDGMADLTDQLTDAPRVQHDSGSPLTINLDGQDKQVDSSMFTTRALGWYMMAAAAHQDAMRAEGGQHTGRSDMATNGAFVMKDPGNAIYKFLAAAPTADSRMSTHFAEKVDHGEKHKIAGLFTSGKPAQRGIEDYRNMLPGQGGTMLFDKIATGQGAGKSEELFVKFESVGCPPYFKTEGHHGTGQAVARFFSALDRNIGHATNFLGSIAERFKSGASEGQVKRQEHVYKGVLKGPVAEPFAALVDAAIKAGVIDASAKEVSRSVHKFGMPYLDAAMDIIAQGATQNGNLALKGQADELRAQIREAVGALGVSSDRHGIERRGAEVHISMNPQDYSQAPRAVVTGRPAADFSASVLSPLSAREQAPTQGATGLLAGVSGGFERDFNRASYSINGQKLDVEGNPQSKNAGLQQLLDALGGDATKLRAVTDVAFQRALAPLALLLSEGHVDLGNGLRSGLIMNGTTHTGYDVQPQPDGSVHVRFDHAIRGFDRMDSLSAGAQHTDPARSNAEFSFTLRIDGSPPHTVSMAKPLTYVASAVLVPPRD